MLSEFDVYRECLEKTKTLICALNFLSRNLPLPQHVFDAVSSIYFEDEEEKHARAKQKMGIDAKVIQAGLFNTTSTAQDRREMLEQIMRRGTSSLGADVPSEREINRLAARSDEEFWMFEKMDEERRRQENYRSRLMEEHEVHDWAYTSADRKDHKKGFDQDIRNLSGKRKRKEVIYADTLSELQWMRAVENGEDMASWNSSSGKRESIPSISNEVMTTCREGERNLFDARIENASMLSEGVSEETYTLSNMRYGDEMGNSSKAEYEGDGEGGWGSLSWNPHKKKRTSFSILGSSSSRGFK